MRVLVIGANGFLGRHIEQRLAVAGWEVVTAGRSQRPGDPVHVQLNLVQDEVVSIAKRLAEVAPDAVVNCAGVTGGSPEELAAGNVIGTAALVEGLFLAGVRARLVHLGSAAEYGLGEPGVPACEGAPTRPVGTYGVTKLAGTRLVQLARTTGLDALVLRVFNPVGPGAPISSLPGRLAAELSRALAEDDAVRLGPLDAVRDFVDARDVADAVHAALIVPVVDRSVLNVGSGRGVPVQALVDQLFAITGFSGPVYQDCTGSPRSMSVPWQQADITTTSAALCWRPRTALATSLEDLWRSVT